MHPSLEMTASPPRGLGDDKSRASARAFGSLPTEPTCGDRSPGFDLATPESGPLSARSPGPGARAGGLGLGAGPTSANRDTLLIIPNYS